MNATTEPGPAAASSRKADTVDELLEGFGPARADQPRVLPRRAVTTPTPAPEAPKKLKETSSTEPGARQRQRNMILALVLSFAIVLVVGIALVRFASH